MGFSALEASSLVANLGLTVIPPAASALAAVAAPVAAVAAPAVAASSAFPALATLGVGSLAIGGGIAYEDSMANSTRKQPVAKPKQSTKAKQSKVTNNNNNRSSRYVPRASRLSGPFGPPSAVTTAPVAIGNTVQGVQSRVVSTRNGVVIHGRDFCFQPVGTTASITNWCLVGGTPLAPAAFVDSCLRQYLQMYNKFRFLGFSAHYITSSPTTSSGDVMFYYGKNRESVFLNQTSNNLLPFVLSDPNTKLGPQWQNMSTTFQVTNDWKSTDYGMTADAGTYADGEIFLLAKTSTADPTGYVLFDYVIEFAEQSTIPRLLTLPVTKAQWSQLGLNINQTTATNVVWGSSTGGSNNLSGTSSVIPSGTLDGDIFKVIIDRTNSTAGPNSVAVFTSNLQSTSIQSVSSLVMSDGMTLYAVYAAGNQIFVFYPNITDAYAGTRPLLASATLTITASVLQVWMSFVGSIIATNVVPNY